MTYDKDLAERIRQTIGSPPGLSEKEMFGGIGFMVQGNMAVGVIGDELMVRIARQDTDQALSEPGTRMFDFTGRPMKGWVMVNKQGYAGDQAFTGWVQRGVEYALTLPPK